MILSSESLLVANHGQIRRVDLRHLLQQQLRLRLCRDEDGRPLGEEAVEPGHGPVCV